MAKRRERFSTTDLYWTEDGDFEVTQGGDFADTSFSITRALKQEIRSTLLARKGDWLTSPSLGANLEDFIGLPNNLRLAGQVGKAIVRALVGHRILNAEDFLVIPTPVEDFLLIRLIVSTPTKDLTIHFGFDSKSKRLMSY